MKKGMDYLKGLRQKLSPENALLSLMESMMPQMAEALQKLQVKKSEGGVLDDAYDKMAFVIVEANGEPLINIIPIRREGDQMVMGKPINTTSAANFFKDLKDGKIDGNTTED